MKGPGNGSPFPIQRPENFSRKALKLKKWGGGPYNWKTSPEGHDTERSSS